MTKIIQELKDKENDNEALIQTFKEKIELKDNQIKKEIEKRIKYKVNFLILEEKFKSKKLQLQKLKEQKVTKGTDKSNLLKRIIKILKKTEILLYKYVVQQKGHLK